MCSKIRHFSPPPRLMRATRCILLCSGVALVQPQCSIPCTAPACSFCAVQGRWSCTHAFFLPVQGRSYATVQRWAALWQESVQAASAAGKGGGGGEKGGGRRS